MTTQENTLARAQNCIEAQDYQRGRALLMSLLPSELSAKDRATRAALLVHCLFSTGAKALARQTIDAELEALPDSFELWLLSSHLYNEEGNREQVEKTLQKATNHCHIPESIMALAAFYTQEGREEEALDCYNRLLRKWPTHSEALFEKASTQEVLGDTQSARETWERLCDAHPEDPEAWLRLGISRSDGGDYQSACKAFNEATRLAPENTAILYNRAVAESRAGNRLQVRACAETMQRVEPDSPRTQIVWAWATEDRRLARRHAVAAANAALSEQVPEQDADLFFGAILSCLHEHGLLDDFSRVFAQALRAERAGPETLAVYREHMGSRLKRLKLFRFSLLLPDSFRDETQPERFPLRHFDVLATSSKKALSLAHQIETLVGNEAPPLTGAIEPHPAPEGEKEGVSYRSPPCYHDELP